MGAVLAGAPGGLPCVAAAPHERPTNRAIKTHTAAAPMVIMRSRRDTGEAGEVGDVGDALAEPAAAFDALSDCDALSASGALGEVGSVPSDGSVTGRLLASRTSWVGS